MEGKWLISFPYRAIIAVADEIAIKSFCRNRETEKGERLGSEIRDSHRSNDLNHGLELGMTDSNVQSGMRQRDLEHCEACLMTAEQEEGGNMEASEG